MQASALSLYEAATEAVFGAAPRQLTTDIAVYLAHVEAGVSMRGIAGALGRHPSTILRAVRRIEAMRDDPLVERTLETVGEAAAPDEHNSRPTKKGEPCMDDDNSFPARGDMAALLNLCEADSFLLVAPGADKAGVFCRRNQFRRPLSLIDAALAADLLRRDWIRCQSRTESSARYRLAAAGKAAIRRRRASEERVETPCAGAPDVFARQHHMSGSRRIANAKTGEIETVRVNLGESPLGWLARRKGADGAPLLSPEEVEAGERLREDYEMAQMGPRIAQDWRNFLAPSGGAPQGRSPGEGPLFARERVATALKVLGPGLSDAALRVCCFLEGLEATERRMGWSARSGKVVLKLALQRLVDHYGLTGGRREAAA